MNNDDLVYSIDIDEPDGGYCFEFDNLDDLLKFCQVCHIAGFKIFRIDTGEV